MISVTYLPRGFSNSNAWKWLLTDLPPSQASFGAILDDCLVLLLNFISISFFFRVKSTLPLTFMSFWTLPPKPKKIERWYLNSIKVSTLPFFWPFSLVFRWVACVHFRYKWSERGQSADFYWVRVSPCNFFRSGGEMQNNIRIGGQSITMQFF